MNTLCKHISAISCSQTLGFDYSLCVIGHLDCMKCFLPTNWRTEIFNKRTVKNEWQIIVNSKYSFSHSNDFVCLEILGLIPHPALASMDIRSGQCRTAVSEMFVNKIHSGIADTRENQTACWNSNKFLWILFLRYLTSSICQIVQLCGFYCCIKWIGVTEQRTHRKWVSEKIHQTLIYSMIYLIVQWPSTTVPHCIFAHYVNVQLSTLKPIKLKLILYDQILNNI